MPKITLQPRRCELDRRWFKHRDSREDECSDVADSIVLLLIA